MNEILSSWLLDATEGILFFGRMIGEGKWKSRRTTKKKTRKILRIHDEDDGD
jgi:hypothetical protein